MAYRKMTVEYILDDREIEALEELLGKWQQYKGKDGSQPFADWKYRLYNSGDALVDRGWILLHNPSQGIAYPTESENHVRTKAQKEFLYDYYMERKCYSEANKIWKEGE